MLALVGSRVRYRTIGRGVFHCERCGGDRPYRHRSGRRLAHVLGIPVASLGGTGEHLCCAVCRTCYRVELLAVPTAEQMLVALLAGTKAAVLAMLRAADAPDGDDEGWLTAALAEPAAAERLARTDGHIGLRPAIEALAVQLEMQAREWFLAKVVEVGLADGSLSAEERAVAGTVARYLGMSASRCEDVISLAEEAAQAG